MFKSAIAAVSIELAENKLAVNVDGFICSAVIELADTEPPVMTPFAMLLASITYNPILFAVLTYQQSQRN